MARPRRSELVRAWRPTLPGVGEVFHARFEHHAYPRHTHHLWTVITLDRGAIEFALDGRRRGSAAPLVTVLPPHVTHDGRAASRGGFAKRVLYVDDRYLSPDLLGPAVDRPTVDDGRLHAALVALHDGLAGEGDPLALETRLMLVADRLATHLRHRPAAGRHQLGMGERAVTELAERVRALLDEHDGAGLTLHDLGTRLGVSTSHVVRSFSAAFSIPPHAYAMGRRIDRARELLLDGLPPADVAADLGFHDQAHLTRHFARHVGTTPARFARRPR